MIIKSLLDTDFYKLTMMQVVLHHFPTIPVEYHFQCRSPEIDLSLYADEIRHAIDQFCNLRFSDDELAYLSTFEFFKPDFIQFLKTFQLNKENVVINNDNGFELMIRGSWLQNILFEVPILAIISEIYARAKFPGADFTIGKKRLAEKIQLVRDQTPAGEFKIIEFGTRRRFSRAWHEQILVTLKEQLPDNLSGTSNIYYAKQLNLEPRGTMAHEFVQAFQALSPQLLESQKMAFTTWLQEYPHDLAIALSDTYNMDVFLKDFTEELARRYQGVRQDSGAPVIFTERLLKHYEKLGIDAKDKVIVYSDALTFPMSIELFKRFHKQINTLFGIGTNLTNDVGLAPMHIVIKMTRCNNQPVAKLSDSPIKTVCRDADYLTHLKKVFNIQ